jgi:epothilone polyketide synthase C
MVEAAPEHSDGGWPIAPDQIADHDIRAQPVAIELMGSRSGWLIIVGRRAAPRARLFCFPFAGGGSAVYRNWAQHVDPRIEVVAVEPPGRLGRINEVPVTDMKEFVVQLVSEMRDLLDRPFAFFGHCLGALTMYETARRLIHTTALRPDHLFASGARPPDRIADRGRFEERVMHDLLSLAEFRIGLPAYAQSDDVFGELIRHFNVGATELLLSEPELRQLMLPVIRAEFQMASNYEFIREAPWDIPITCFAAKGDPYVSRQHALGWGRFTNSRLQVHIREGAHFAVVDDAAFIHGVINRELKDIAATARPDGPAW